MNGFVLTLVLAAVGAPDYPGPPSFGTPAPSYHASMTACVSAGRRAERDFGSPRVFVRFSCAYRGDRRTSANPFRPWFSAEDEGY